MAFQGDSIFWVEVEKVVPNPFQPRREFDQNKLQELAESIRMYGVLQPLTVTRKEVQREDGTFYTKYELIAGERRLRASKLAGTAQVPVIIREGEQNEQEKLELAIIENLQREDLNAVDRAVAFKQLAEQFKLSHAHVAKKMGRSREYVSNSIRLLALPEHMLTSLRQGDMMEGHARTLLMLTDRPEEQKVIFREVVLKKLSVREVERIVRKIATDKVRKKTLTEADFSLIEFEKKFTETLGTRVQILKTDFGGKLTIDYFSEDDLEAILKRMHEEAVDKKPDSVSRAERLTAVTPLDITAPVEEKTSFVEAVKNPESDRVPVAKPYQPPQTESIPETLIENHFSAEAIPDQIPNEAQVNIFNEKVAYVPSTPVMTDQAEELESEDFFSPTPPTQSPVMPPQPAPEPNRMQMPVITPSNLATERVRTDFPLTPRIKPESKVEAVGLTTENNLSTETIETEEKTQPENQQANVSSLVDKPTKESEMVPVKTESDESDLYSINNFTV